MGASGSTISSDLKGKVIRKDLLDPEILVNVGNASSLPDEIPVEKVFNALKNRTDVFLTHNWGQNQDNHKRVAQINHGLKEKGLVTWFDGEKMEGNVKKKMTEGIDNSSCVVAFITELYIDKVKGDNAEDNCQLEFGYSARCKTAKRMVPVVMESHVRNTSAWKGEVGMVLGGLLYVDMCDAISDDKITELHDRIVSVNEGVKVNDLFQKCLSLAMSHATLPSGAAPAGGHAQAAGGHAQASSHDSQGEVYEWLIHTVKLTPKAAHATSTILLEGNIGTVDRLVRRYHNDSNLFNELGIDSFDAEDIVKVLDANYPASSPKPEDPPADEEAPADEAAAAPEGESSGYTDDMMIVQVSAHDHCLVVVDDDNGWGCNGMTLEGGCRQGCTGGGQSSGWKRHRCGWCDFDLCVECVSAHFVAGQVDDSEMTVAIHPHVLKKVDPDNSGWACDGRKADVGGGCCQGCTDFYQTSGWVRYTCKACGFDLCLGCAVYHAQL